MFIDSHCHLTTLNNISTIVDSAIEKNVLKMVNCPSATNFERCVALSENFEAIETCLGVYPIDTHNLENSEFEKLLMKMNAFADKIVGVGEIGLDYKYGKSDAQRKLQKAIFIRQIRFAKEYNLPVVVHSRFAEEDAIATLEKEKAENVLMHWFAGSEKLCKEVIDNGWFISVAPRVVHNEQYAIVLKKIPIENLLLETDSPVPFEGKPTTPALIPFVAKRLAEIKELSLNEVEHITTENARKLFGF